MRHAMPTLTPMPTWADTPRPGASDPRRRYGGVPWSFDAIGVYIDGAAKPQRTPGEPLTCRAICDLFAPILIERSMATGIAPELIVMLIAAETAAFRSSGFTGPPTFHWEPDAIVRDAPPVFRGDYSVGPMQVLASFARMLMRQDEFGAAPLAAFPVYRFRPAAPPQDIPGYAPPLNVRLGVAVMQGNRARSGDDPILTAAIHNSGGVYDASRSRKYSNRWHLRSTGNYLDRAAQWYGDACAIIGALRGKD